MKGTVTVVIPAYNAERFLERSVRSALDQTRPAHEIIVVDDGSTDRTGSIAEQLPGIVVIHQRNAGVSAARNAGLDAATGHLVAFLDADDEWLPQKLARQVAEFVAAPSLGLVHCGVHDIDETGTVLREHLDGLSGWVREDLLRLQRPVVLGGGSGLVVPRAVLRSIGGFDPALSTSADWDLFVRIATDHPIGFVPEPLVRYRSHDGQMHLDVDTMRGDMLRALAKAFDAAPAPQRRLRRAAYARLHLILAGSYLEASDPRRATAHLVRSVLGDPRSLGYALGAPLRRLRRRGRPTIT